MNYEEQRTQMLFVEYLQRIGIWYFNHSANEGKRTAQEGNKLKKMGMSKGFPDLEIPLPRGDKHGLYIEFKSETGKPTPEQKRWLEYLRKQGYEAILAYSFEEARKGLHSYLNSEVKK